VLKESVAYGRMLLQSLFSPEPQNMPHIARYAVLLANSLGAEPILSADVLGVTHLVQRGGGSPEVLHAISGLVAEAACICCIQAAADVTSRSTSAVKAGTSPSVVADLKDRNATVEQLLSAAIVIAGSGSSGIADHDAAAGIAMLSLAVRVSRFDSVCAALIHRASCRCIPSSQPALNTSFRVDSRRSEAITVAERGRNVLITALGAQHPSTSSALDLVAKLRGSFQLRVPDWLLNDSIWRR
jgi:hypothetical protein